MFSHSSVLQTCRFTFLIYRACSVAAGTICGQRCTSRSIQYRLFCTPIDRRRFVSQALPLTFVSQSSLLLDIGTMLPSNCYLICVMTEHFVILMLILAVFTLVSSVRIHSVWLSRNTNKMQLCNGIYYSKVYWRLNMFRAAHRSSSGALNCICNLWFIYPYGDRPLSRLSGKWINFPLSLGNGRSLHVYINQRLQIQFRAPDDERCATRNMLSLQLWNNKFYYKAASCWYFYWVIYDARIHEYQIYNVC